MILTAADLRPGVCFKYNGHPVEILRGLEKRKDRFGQELDSWWSRRIDTGDEGYVSLGPGGVLRVEPLKTARAQLEREIAASLATPIQQRAETSTEYKRRASGRKSHAQKKAPLLERHRSSSSGVTTIADRLFDGKAWTITRHPRPNGTHFYQLTEMAGHRTDWPTREPDGRVLYDRPQQIPSRVAAWVSRVLPRE